MKLNLPEKTLISLSAVALIIGLTLLSIWTNRMVQRDNARQWAKEARFIHERDSIGRGRHHSRFEWYESDYIDE